MVDPLPPDIRPKSRWSKPMYRSLEQPAKESVGERKSTAEVEEIRARLLKMIVQNEEARKPKSP